MGKFIEVSEEKTLFQLLFLKADKARRIEVEEIDFREVEQHLKLGEAVFISTRHKQRPNRDLTVNEKKPEPWYFMHV